ncbi:hypothetical protein ACVWWN_007768 [Mycobacterium sp. URHB0021]|jgi:hypothetical protein
MSGDRTVTRMNHVSPDRGRNQPVLALQEGAAVLVAPSLAAGLWGRCGGEPNRKARCSAHARRSW